MFKISCRARTANWLCFIPLETRTDVLPPVGNGPDFLYINGCQRSLWFPKEWVRVREAQMKSGSKR
jgi:hypothetical protein